VLTESEYAQRQATRAEHEPANGSLHPLCALLRQLRIASRLSLAQFEARFGIPAVVVGAYERGDRIPPLPKLEAILACFGYKLVAVPANAEAVRPPLDMVADLRAIANQLEAGQPHTQLEPIAA